MRDNRLSPSDPDVPATYTINWEALLIDPIQRCTQYATGFIGRPGKCNGLYYEATAAGSAGRGKTARRRPKWPTTAGQTVRDGTVTWTARDVDAVSVATVQGAAWTLDTGFTLDSQSESIHNTHLTVSGGEDGREYEATCRMTPTSGEVRERTIVIPRRSL